jgi:hypothetical protein
MKNILLKVAAIFAFAALAPIVRAAPGIGTDAPDFSLPTADGGTETLARHMGKFVVLEWTNPACPFVLRHYLSGNMQKLQAEETAKGVVWLTIDSSAKGREGYVTAEQAGAWIKDKKLACSAFLLDPDGKVGKLYGAKATPSLFIISPEGKLLYSGAIDSIASADPADIAKATNYVRAGLQEAMAGKAVTTTMTRAYGCSVKY